MTKYTITEASVFDDLGFSDEEALNLRIRATLMRAISDHIKRNKLTQKQAAEVLGVTQPRVSDLKRGKIHLFTIDILINMMAKIKVPVSLVIDDRLAA